MSIIHPLWLKSNMSLEKYMENNSVNEDHYEEVFSSLFMNSIKVGLYLLGLGCCGVLALVVGFEVTGKAGPYRTLVNQIVSFNITQVRMLLCFLQIQID